LKLEFLGELATFFETILGYESLALEEMFEEKTGVKKNLMRLFH
jgi:hypothetical protein